MKRLIIAVILLLGVASAAYKYSPGYASRIYIWAGSDSAPGRPTGVLRDTSHYPLNGYLSLFCNDTTNSIRAWMSPTDTTPYLRFVTDSGDTTLITANSVYTNGVLNASLLQGKDTTALFDAKTLQGKDTLGIWIHAGTDSTGRMVADSGKFNRLVVSDASVVDTGRMVAITSVQNIATPTFYGAGLNDITVQGFYAGHLTADTFFVKCYYAGATDTMQWKRARSGTYAKIAAQTALKHMAVGCSLRFAAITGHTVNDSWRIPMTATCPIDVKFPSGLNALKIFPDGASQIGMGASATGLYASATGLYASATGGSANAIGSSASATGSPSVAIGSSASATGSPSVAIGSSASASNSYATANGPLTSVSGYGATATGTWAAASGSYATASGYYASAGGEGAVASGYSAAAGGYGAIATGSYASAPGSYANASGYYASAGGVGASASGFYAIDSANRGTAVGESIAVRAADTLAQIYGAGEGSFLRSSGKRTQTFGIGGKNFVTYSSPGAVADSLVVQSGVDLIVHGPVKIDSNVTIAGTDSAQRQVGDTIRFTKGGGMTCVITGANAWAAGLSDTASGAQSVVAGGKANKASGDSSAVGGGTRNKATERGATIAGGRGNIASGIESFVGGGQANSNGGQDASIVGGVANTISGAYSFIGGGYNNDVRTNSIYSFIGGGTNNVMRGILSVIPGGDANIDSAPYSALLGDSLCAKATDTFSFGVGAGAGAGRLVSPGKRTVWWGVGGINQVAWGADSTVIQPGVDLIVHGPAKIDSSLTVARLIVGDTVLIRTAGAAFAATKRFETYADSCAGVDSIQLTALNASGARARVITLRDSVFVKDGATVVKILSAAGKWCDLEYLGAPCSRWQVFGSN